MTWLPLLMGAAPLVAAHPLEIEQDLQRFYHVDYRDRWRDEGGASRLTYRRLLSLLDGLPPESAFRCAVMEMPPVSRLEWRLVEIWEAWVGKAHAVRDPKKQQRERKEAAERDQEFQRQRAAARKRNKAVLAARKRKGA